MRDKPGVDVGELAEDPSPLSISEKFDHGGAQEAGSKFAEAWNREAASLAVAHSRMTDDDAAALVKGLLGTEVAQGLLGNVLAGRLIAWLDGLFVAPRFVLRGDVTTEKLEMCREVKQSGAHAVIRDADDPRDLRQRLVVEWAKECFGVEEATSPPQRAIRVLEEAVELAQACGVGQEIAEKLVRFVFGRPTGHALQEIGGLSVCLLALAESVGASADAEERREVERVLSLPRDHFAERNQQKNAAGFRIKGLELDPIEIGVTRMRTHVEQLAIALGYTVQDIATGDDYTTFYVAAASGVLGRVLVPNVAAVSWSSVLDAKIGVALVVATDPESRIFAEVTL